MSSPGCMTNGPRTLPGCQNRYAPSACWSKNQQPYQERKTNQHCKNWYGWLVEFLVRLSVFAPRSATKRCTSLLTPREGPNRTVGLLTPRWGSPTNDFTGKPSDERSVGTYSDNKKLIIGREIVLSGEISACEKLIVEGCVETSTIKDCRKIEIAEGGIFKGDAEIEIAEIAGHFEGTILATNILLVRSTGIIKGTIRAERIEIERGGKISGHVQMELEKQGQ